MSFNKNIYDQCASKGFCQGVHRTNWSGVEQSCVEAAISMSLGEGLHDVPSCVDWSVRSITIKLNDLYWQSSVERAKGMYRLGLLGLNTKHKIDSGLFVTQYIERLVRTVLLPMIATSDFNNKEVQEASDEVIQATNLTDFCLALAKVHGLLTDSFRSVSLPRNHQDFKLVITYLGQLGEALFAYTVLANNLAAVLSSSLMQEHKALSELPEDHPDYRDFYANIIVGAFKLPCEPTKQGLASRGDLELRTVAKIVFFLMCCNSSSLSIVNELTRQDLPATHTQVNSIIAYICETYGDIYNPGYAELVQRLVNVVTKLQVNIAPANISNEAPQAFTLRLVKITEDILVELGFENEYSKQPLPDFTKALANECI